MPPALRTFEEFAESIRADIVSLEKREAQLVEAVNGCVGNRVSGVVCGLPTNEAPNPWMALDGVPCRGYSTKQTRELDYCGYWDSEYNVNAAPSDLKQELMRVGPHCKTDDGSVVFCSANSSRTQRAGIYELKYMMRDDRAYCSSQFVRERLTPEEKTEEKCREELARRNDTCYTECVAPKPPLLALW